MADKESPVLYSAPNPNSIEAAVPADNVGMGQKDVGWNQRKEEGRQEIAAGTMDEGTWISERQRRMKTEIFIGGMSRETTEEDLRKVFGKVGEIVEIRFKTSRRTGKSKGYPFLRYREAAQAKRAISEFRQVKICGKLCGASALKGNDAILLGNIDKKWKDADVVKLLQNAEIEKIDTITMMANPTNANINSGFAFIEFETNRDAHIAYIKLKREFY